MDARSHESTARASASGSDRASLLFWLCAAGVIGTGLWVRLPALEVGFAVDDYAQLGMLQGDYPVQRGPLELFSFSNGHADEVQRLIDAGFFPWWSYPRLKLSMLRPLSSVLMWLDLSLFGQHALGYHLHSLLWWLAMVGLTALVLRRVLSPVPALLALVFFVLDETHTMLLGWLALRNETIASAFALLALYAYLRHRERPHVGWAALVAGAYVLALGGGEYALPFLGYFVCLELFERGPLRPALARLSLVVLPALAFLAVRRFSGFGSFGSMMYVDPLREPTVFAGAILARLPALAADLAFAYSADWWSYGMPGSALLGTRFGYTPLAPWNLAPTWNLQWPLGVLALVVAGYVVRALCRRDAVHGKAVAWLGLGAGLSLLPILAVYPSARLLAGPVVGWSAVLGVLVYRLLSLARARRGRLWFAAGVAGVGIACLHSVVPALSSRLQALEGVELARVLRRSILEAPLGPHPARTDVMLFGAADVTTTIYIPLLRAFYGAEPPRSCHLLVGGFSPYALSRTGDDVFELARQMPGTNPGDLYAATFNRHPIYVGQAAYAGPMRVDVLEAFGGVPLRTRHTFATSLDDPSLIFLQQTKRGLRRVAMPPVGESIVIEPPVPPFEIGR